MYLRPVGKKNLLGGLGSPAGQKEGFSTPQIGPKAHGLELALLGNLNKVSSLNISARSD